jgi:hypothetical protein
LTAVADFCFGPARCPAARRWTVIEEPAGEPVGLRDAVRWLQTESGSPCRVPVAVIGPRDAGVAERQAAFTVGAGLADLGIVLLCGGKGGVMEAACEGAASAGGMSIGLLPDDEWQAANRFVTIPIATGIGVARNASIVRAGWRWWRSTAATAHCPRSRWRCSSAVRC